MFCIRATSIFFTQHLCDILSGVHLELVFGLLVLTVSTKITRGFSIIHYKDKNQSHNTSFDPHTMNNQSLVVWRDHYLVCNCVKYKYPSRISQFPSLTSAEQILLNMDRNYYKKLKRNEAGILGFANAVSGRKKSSRCYGNRSR